MIQNIVDSPRIGINVPLNFTLDQTTIPYDPSIIHNMKPDVERQLVTIFQMKRASLKYHEDYTESVKRDAIFSTDPNSNDLIAEFVANEPYIHVGTMLRAFSQMKSREIPLAPEAKEIVLGLINHHLLVAREAVEAAEYYKAKNSPTELWNYLERMWTSLEIELYKVGPGNKKITEEIMNEITAYRILQEKLVFTE